MRKRWRKILLWVLATPVVLFFAFLLFERFRGEISLARFKRELAAKGETLDVHKLLAPPVPDADNGAPGFSSLVSSLREGKVLPLDWPPEMKLIAPGKAIVGFRQSSWVDDKVTNTWEEASAELAINRETLEHLRLVLAKPGFDFKLDHSKGFDMLLPHLAPAKSLAMWFSAAFQNSLRNGEIQAALSNLLAAISIPRVLGHDRIVINELVRIAINSITERTVWEALQTNVWTDAQLAQIQKAWERNTFATNMVRALRVERADGDTYYPRFRKSNRDTYRAMFPVWGAIFGDTDSESAHWWGEESFRKQVYCRLWRFAWLNQDEKHYLEQMEALIHDSRTGSEIAAGAPPVNFFGFPMTKADQNFYDNWRFGVSAQTMETLSLARLKSLRAETDRSLVLCAIALKRYSLRHGKSPPDLGTLVPEFLPSIPIDSMDGKPIKYRLNADGTFLLYSVGDDGRDDGGDPAPANPAQTYSWIWRGKDVVWPAPATQAEITEFNATHSGN